MRRASCRSSWSYLTVFGLLLTGIFVIHFWINNMHSTNVGSSVRPASVDADAEGKAKRLLQTVNSQNMNIRHVVDMLPVRGVSSNEKLPADFERIAVEPELDETTLTLTTNESIIESIFFRYLKRLQLKCPRSVRVGRKEDGGWDVCISGPFNISTPCLVYSIGMGGEWSFDEMITSKYGCQDMAYDPTLGKPDHTPKPNLWFHNIGLGATNHINDNRWQLNDFPTLLNRHNHIKTVIDILKIDIEYAEWDSLEAMLAQPSCLDNVKQLSVEYHTREMTPGKSSSTEDHLRYWSIVRGLDKLGFKIWNYWDNPSCNFKSNRTANLQLCGCTNVYYVNTNFLKSS